jgi:hypothetical protein
MARASKSAREREQSARFIEAARELGCDDDPEAFERAFAKIVPSKTGQPKPKTKRPSR